MDLKSIEKVVELMEKSQLTEFEIEEEGLKLKLSRQKEVQTFAPAPMAAPVAPVAPAPAAVVQDAGPTQAAAPEDTQAAYIKSPMVGTFYSSASPDKPAFVEVGKEVTANTVVCIIEAMKVMNEVHAELDGKILEVMVKNGQAVEYGQPLFKVSPR